MIDVMFNDISPGDKVLFFPNKRRSDCKTSYVKEVALTYIKIYWMKYTDKVERVGLRLSRDQVHSRVVNLTALDSEGYPSLKRTR